MKSESFITPPVKTAEMSFDVAERGSDGSSLVPHIVGVCLTIFRAYVGPLAFGYPVTLSNLEGPYQEVSDQVHRCSNVLPRRPGAPEGWD